jgi:predicted DNA-binding transcriptional regulator YafY
MELMVRVNELQKFTVDELAVEYGVSYRTMLRYLQELSVMGVPLYAEVGKYGGYSILKTKMSKPLITSKPSKETDQTYFYALEMLRKEGYDHDTNAFCLELYK